VHAPLIIEPGYTVSVNAEHVAFIAVVRVLFVTGLVTVIANLAATDKQSVYELLAHSHPSGIEFSKIIE
jgi:uncharacterized membrane protein AbrB (regulator of aidB expression)